MVEADPPEWSRPFGLGRILAARFRTGRPDTAVFGAYGWPEDVADDEILRNLLTPNGERSILS